MKRNVEKLEAYLLMLNKLIIDIHTMKQNIYQVDAFTDRVFGGNPAAVCPLKSWLSDTLLQQIAMENNLAETAFYVREDNHYQIRWFTPTIEVDLCGHATLAAAFVLFHLDGHTGDRIQFQSPMSGALSVTRDGDWLTLDFPADRVEEVPLTEALIRGLSIKPVLAYKGRTDYLLVYDSEEAVKNVIPNFDPISKLDARGIIITAPGTSVDFVSRFFAPQSGVDEDPVTGSAHTTLIPYWSQRLNKSSLIARQLSKRGGYLKCEEQGERVAISGQARLYMIGDLNLDADLAL